MKKATKITLFLVLLILAAACKTEQQIYSEIGNAPDTLNLAQHERASENDLIEIELPLDTILNSERYIVLSNKPGDVKVIRKDEKDNYSEHEILIGYRNELIISKTLNWEDVKIQRKYQPTTSFLDYKVEMYTGPLAEPDFETTPEAKMFITRITNGCKEGINFAGHYTLITWGCGSPCQSGVVVDRKTGQIHLGYGTSLGSKFRPDSKMIIINVGAIDTTTNLIHACASCAVSHEIWNGKEFIEVE